MRVILVPLGGDDSDKVALGAAYAIAGSFRSHIDALFVRPDLVDKVSNLEGGSPEVLGSVIRATTAKWDERARRAKQAFDAARAAADAALADQPTGTDTVTTRWSEVTGIADELVPVRGRHSDLLVFAGVEEGDGSRRRIFEAALMSAARPILLVPKSGAESIGRSIAVAWNGSAEAARAVAGALPMLQNAEQVHVLTAAGPHVQVEQAKSLAHYLGWHGIISETHALYPKTRVGAALLDRAKELGADLVVMGAYGHSRVRELIFGGVTHHVVGHHDLPVLVAR